MIKIINKKRVLLSILFLITSFVFLLLFSWSTSFLFDYKTTDSGIFQVIGKFSNRGLDFYKDLFDHKGPIMFLIEKISYFIVDSKVGVFLVQIVFWFFTLCGTYKIIRQFFSTKATIILSEFSLLLYALYYSGVGGNTSEEYILPFLVWSIYFTLVFILRFDNKCCEHSPWYSFFYGISFAVGAYTRLTNALPICISVLVILGLLIYKKKWKNILKNAAFLIMGVLVITIPIVIWFVANGTFGDMIDATFLANIKYSQVHRYHYSAKQLMMFFARYRMILLASLVVGVIGLKNKKYKLLSILVIAHVLGSIAIDLSTPMFSYYAMIWTPTVLVSLCMAYYYKWCKWISRVVLYGTLLFLIINGARLAHDCYLAKIDNRLAELRQCVVDVKKNISSKEYNNVIAYNTSPYFYLESGIPPCYRNFILQDFHCSFNEKSRKQFEKDIKSLKATFIVEEKTKEKSKMDVFIDNKYHVIKQNKWLVLKKRNR